MSEISDWRYSSIVKWKASRSLRLTGTVKTHDCQKRLADDSLWASDLSRSLRLPRSSRVVPAGLRFLSPEIHRAIRRGRRRNTRIGQQRPLYRHMPCSLQHSVYPLSRCCCTCSTDTSTLLPPASRCTPPALKLTSPHPGSCHALLAWSIM